MRVSIVTAKPIDLYIQDHLMCALHKLRERAVICFRIWIHKLGGKLDRRSPLIASR